MSELNLHDAEAQLTALLPTPFPLPLGRMMPIVEGGFRGMKKSDWIVCGMRERVGAVLRGCSPERLVDGHAGARPYKVAPVSDAPGTRALHAVGLAMGSSKPVLCFLGMASSASGSFHEALNSAVLTDSPVIFLVTVQDLSTDAPVGTQLATTPAKLATAFGISVKEIKCDATAIAKAVQAARKACKPALIQVQLEPQA